MFLRVLQLSCFPLFQRSDLRPSKNTCGLSRVAVAKGKGVTFDLCCSLHLTLFQSPLDRARVLADGVQVPVQRGHKQQALGEGDRASAAKQLQGDTAKK